jgi:inorganic pyrophosphatase
MSSVPRTDQRLTDQGGETDWKVLAIDVNDPLAPLIDGKSLIPIRIRLTTQISRMLKRTALAS